MYVYPSVDELMYRKLTKLGSVVLIPLELLNLMVNVLNPLDPESEGDMKLVSAPFYVLKVPPLPTIVKVDKTEQDFKLGAKTEVTVPTANVTGSISATYKHRYVAERIRAINLFSLETSLANEYLDEIEEIINFLYTSHEIKLEGKPLFIVYGKRIDTKIIDLLSEETVNSGNPIYIAVPIKLETNRVDKRIIRVLKPFAEQGNVATLLGIDPLPVHVKVGKTEYEVSFTHYLVMQMLKYVLESNPKDKPEDKYYRYMHLADYIMRLLFEEVTKKGETVQEAKEKYSVSTIFLNSLYVTLVLEYRPHLHRYRNDSIYERLHDIYESAKMTALNQQYMLAKYAKLLGATDETIRVIRCKGWMFKPYGFTLSWSEETKKYREREELLSV